MLKFWKSYKYRFTPWLMFNFHKRSSRRVYAANDKIIDDVAVVSQLCKLTNVLADRIGYLHYAPFIEAKAAVAHQKALKIMDETYGFHVKRHPSLIKGEGVVIRSQTKVADDTPVVQKGSLVGIYPGTLYVAGDPILLQSIGNRFIFKCADGTFIDGNHQYISRHIYLSCVGRDRICWSSSFADKSWLTPYPLNPLSIGQFVNNSTPDHPSNVAYQELTVYTNYFSEEELRFLPNIWYHAMSHADRKFGIKMCVLIATRDIKQNEELFSNYFTLISTKS